MSLSLVMAFFGLSSFAALPVSAQTNASWTLDCKGNAHGAASWIWLQDGVAIPGASGSASCDATMSATGTSARPATANGLTVSVTANGATRSDTFSFGTTQSVKVHLGTGDSARVCVPLPESRNCVWTRFSERAHFSLES